MGLFDKIFGRGASETVARPDAQQQFNQLRSKYAAAIQRADEQGIRLTALQMKADKLHFSGIAPTEQAKDSVWDKIKEIDSDYSDLIAEIKVHAATTPLAWGIDEKTMKSYTVKSGDSLSKISKEFYGDADEYMRIFYANRDKIDDPDKIQIGQVLAIPADDDN